VGGLGKPTGCKADTAPQADSTSAQPIGPNNANNASTFYALTYGSLGQAARPRSSPTPLPLNTRGQMAMGSGKWLKRTLVEQVNVKSGKQ
jgi:hypothetical protein